VKPTVDKPESKDDLKSLRMPELQAKALDLRPRIATRAYELYERGGRREGHTGQDWLEVEREIRKRLGKG
jgi:hypothetical protein